MRSVSRRTVLLLLTAAGAKPALADFRLAAPQQMATISDVPHVQPGDLPSALRRRVGRMGSLPRARRLPSAAGRRAAPDGVVEGFGADVPLSFACRQIMPKTIKVVLAPDVDPETPVTWRGGRSWAAVMRDALQPAGLTLVPHGETVEIRK